jgi:hypothetical protein
MIERDRRKVERRIKAARLPAEFLTGALLDHIPYHNTFLDMNGDSYTVSPKAASEGPADICQIATHETTSAMPTL